MRLIDADAFAEFLADVSQRQKYEDLKVDGLLTVADVLDAVISELKGTGIEGFKNAPTIEPEREWISCKPVNDNYLPDLKDKYMMILVTYRTGRGRVRKVKACLCNYGSIEKKVPGIITAYKPFPEPYMEEGEPDD